MDKKLIFGITVIGTIVYFISSFFISNLYATILSALTILVIIYLIKTKTEILNL